MCYHVQHLISKYLPIIPQLSTDNLKIVSVPDVITDGPPNVVIQYFPSIITCTISEKKNFTKFMKIMKIIIYYFGPLYN